MEFQDVKVGDRFRLRPNCRAIVYRHDKRVMRPGEVITITTAGPGRLGATCKSPGYQDLADMGFKTPDWFFRTFEKVEAKSPVRKNLEFADLKPGDRLKLKPGEGAGVDFNEVDCSSMGDPDTPVGNAVVQVVSATQNQLVATSNIPGYEGREFTVVNLYWLHAFEKVEAPVRKENLEFSTLKVGDQIQLKRGKKSRLGGVDIKPQDVLTVLEISPDRDYVAVATEQQVQTGKYTSVTKSGLFADYRKVDPKAKPCGFTWGSLRDGDVLEVRPGAEGMDRVRLDDGDWAAPLISLPDGTSVVVHWRDTKIVATILAGSLAARTFTVDPGVQDWFIDGFRPLLKDATKMTSKFTWDKIKPGDRFVVKPGAMPRPSFTTVSDDDDDEYLTYGTVVEAKKVLPRNDAVFTVVQGTLCQGEEFTLARSCLSWLTENFDPQESTTTPNMPDRLVVRGQVFKKVDDPAPTKETTKMTSTLTWNNLEVGDVLKVKPGETPGTDFIDDPNHNERLCGGNIVRVTEKNETHVTLAVVEGDEKVRGRTFTVERHTEFSWLTDYFVRVVYKGSTTPLSEDSIDFDDIKAGDRFVVKTGGAPDVIFLNGGEYDLPADTIVRVSRYTEDEIFLIIERGISTLRGRVCKGSFDWLNTYFTKIQEVNMADKYQEKSTTMANISTTNRKAAGAVRQGLKQAGARMAHRALIAQVEKALGRKFPRAFFSTAAGKALLDLGSCYLVMAATEMLPEHPLANRANEVAGLALTAATYDHAVPLIEVATRLIEGAAGIDILGK